ncbi:MAG: tRNA (N6-isopentenyl adenosine(37)-C2)-methylthiotransferase MiaB [Oscillospiraceae bacterium]|nr:tRNA (N6-isopentenyl adenosine(37)-C2)-methylthiotransferase MiaB [Oscillospiraceae bacterium]
MDNYVKKAYIRTYGCKQNFADSEKISGFLALSGFEIVKTAEEADLILFNTCAVRENAEQRVFGNVGALKKLKADKPETVIVLSGCMTQQSNIAERFKTKFPFIDTIIGTDILSRLPEIIAKVGSNERKSTVINIGEAGGSYGDSHEGVKPLREGLYTANVPIMNGCDNFCTYCVVPLVRGREVSRRPENIVAEVKELIAEGRKDILLLGQNVNSFGKGSNYGFIDLLRELDSIPGEFIIDYMTSHPKDCGRELLDFIANSRNISRHLHLPVQSGSNRILSLMNRGYTREQYMELAAYAKAKIPAISLTTDILVGFPGETYEDFKDTLDLVEKIGFDSAYTFIYSKREGTKAAEMADFISADEKSAWFKELLDLQGRIGERSYERYIGKTLRVLCLGQGRSDPQLQTGKSRQGIIVDFSGAVKAGEFADVRVTRALPWALVGELTVDSF